jgi:imidazolonepropionase-like amidohydrolase
MRILSPDRRCAVSATVFQNVDVFPGYGDALLRGRDVIVEGTTISAVVATGTAAIPEGAHVVEGRGRTLMPGLIDAHWHSAFCAVNQLQAVTADVGFLHIRAGLAATETLHRGFTTVRDCGGPAFGLKLAVDSGLVAGPRIYPSGAFITQTAGHGDFRLPFEIPADPCCGLSHIERKGASRIADGVDAVLTATREQLMLGASQIKVMAGGGVSSSYDPIDVTQYTEPEIRAAVECAENWGTYVMVHAYTSRSIQQAIRAGVRCIEHGQLADEETVETIAEQGVWWCLQPFLGDEDANPKPPHLQAKQRAVAEGTDRAYRLAIEHGVKVAWGTDILFSAEGTAKQGRHLAKLTRWYSPAEILTMATSTNAELLAMSGERNPYPGRLGVVEDGAMADLLLLDGNPLADIDIVADPTRLAVVMKDGVIHLGPDRAG